ncbi:PLP-dependent aminotransferase family protein [Agarivorans sp. 1_MG-2023]|uniref:MocR-like pyridoxine biosynthesis transcription factor PdxR n=1 Tax=Agarivorans sp. 1_MG-2023 TaxID=3062634 RepID=UPI0026E1B632|nr:PLP-dependent aminotransferase family protein [Agarivorans sp. 1_MG-2023]MDO6763392.1 PLP-dependent aminotransferase family protein [Agarivorans sp. 1_MG-2023]
MRYAKSSPTFNGDMGMNDCMMNIELRPGRGLQQQIREKLVELIQHDYFGTRPLPSSRKMAQRLKVSRNTVVLVYESMVDEGYLVARERSGFFVNPELDQEPTLKLVQSRPQLDQNRPNWQKRLASAPASFSTLNKDKNWISYPYPFIYGQIEPSHFPIYQWRECSRIAQNRNCVHKWIEDYVDVDDLELVTQIRQQILSKRGITASNEEILITMGTQNSLFMLASLLAGDGVDVGVENPGYADFRHIFNQCGSKPIPLALDHHGLQLGQQLSQCDYVCVTPSHQYPTTVTMPIERRKALLAQAAQDDFVLIEDDYESEVNFIEQPLPALKSIDQDGRVIYIGSLSKSLSPGLRIGYLVANKSLVKELRALRRLVYRHPPANNQRTAALFIGQGYYDSHVRRMRHVYEQKWLLMQQGLQQHLPQCEVHATPGSFCFWIALPPHICSSELVIAAAKQGILVESGDSLFAQERAPKNYIRVGFSAISEDRISAGLTLLGSLVAQIANTTCTQAAHSY